MSNLTPIDNRGTNPPKNGWLWVQDYSPELVKLYFLSTAISDWLFWLSFLLQKCFKTGKLFPPLKEITVTY